MKNFTPLSHTQSTCGTFNVDDLLAQHAQALLLPDGRIEQFMKLLESECNAKLGEPYQDWDNEKGHTKEWYYTAPSGNLVGIGFRHGCPRLRGNWATTVDDVVDFVDFLQQAVKN